MTALCSWQLTREYLATLLVEELNRDKWGDIDLQWLEMVADGTYDTDDAGHDEAEALARVLDRVVARLKEHDTTQGARATRIAASAKPPWHAAPWACGHKDPVYRGPHAQACAVCGAERYEPGHEVKP